MGLQLSGLHLPLTPRLPPLVLLFQPHFHSSCSSPAGSGFYLSLHLAILPTAVQVAYFLMTFRSLLNVTSSWSLWMEIAHPSTVAVLLPLLYLYVMTTCHCIDFLGYVIYYLSPSRKYETPCRQEWYNFFLQPRSSLHRGRCSVNICVINTTVDKIRTMVKIPM